MATPAAPPAPFLTRKPAAIVPPRIATKVPISTRPLPPVSSSSRRCCGRYAYFTGPKRVECTPMRNTAAYSSAGWRATKPVAAMAITAISRFFTKRMSAPFSTLSAIWPEVADRSTKGAMKTAPIAKPAVAGSTPPHCAAWKVASSVNANLSRLSFAAPRNCVQKSGAKRRSPNSANWLREAIVRPSP